MLEPKLKVAVDYEKCHPERCDKGVCAAVLECPAKLWKQQALRFALPHSWVWSGVWDMC